MITDAPVFVNKHALVRKPGCRRAKEPSLALKTGHRTALTAGMFADKL